MEDEHAVFVVVVLEHPGLVAELGAVAFGFPGFAAAELSHQFLDVGGGAVLGNHDEVVFVLGGGDAGHRTDFGVADGAAAEGGAGQRQCWQRLGDADFLSGRAQRDAAFPVEPVGAGLDAPLAPAVLCVEGLQEHEEAIGRGIDVSVEGGDFYFELAECEGGRVDFLV